MSSSIKLFFWVVLAAVGGFSASYGVERSPFNVPILSNMSLAELQKLAPDINGDVLEYMCQKLEQTKTQ